MHGGKLVSRFPPEEHITSALGYLFEFEEMGDGYAHSQCWPMEEQEVGRLAGVSFEKEEGWPAM